MQPAPAGAVEAAPQPAAPMAAAPVTAAPMQQAAAAPVVVAAAQPGMMVSGEWVIRRAEYGLFFIKLIGWIITALTFGLAYPIAANMYWGAWAKKVRIEGRPIRYSGTAGGLFGIWIKVFILTLITLTIYYWFWGHKAVAKYIDQHISW